MRSDQPPRVATWLLRHFGSSPNNAAIIGDLDERYRHGRSRVWYWTQVIKAIAAGMAREVHAHKLLTLGAVTFGWMLSLIEGLLVVSLGRVLRDTVILHPDASLAVFIIVSCFGWIGIGWVLKKLCSPYERPMVLAFASTVFAAVVFIALVQLNVASPSIAHPVLLGISGNVTGLLCVFLGAGLLRKQRFV
jgi:hypothetical protein